MDARKAAENGDAHACAQLAMFVYDDSPYARDVGHVEENRRGRHVG
jgi:hypothetical protein